jgi:hypothetical protein
MRPLVRPPAAAPTNAAAAAKKAPAGTNAISAKAVPAKSPASKPARALIEQVRKWRASRAFYPSLAGAAVVLGAVCLLVWFKRQKRRAPPGESVASVPPPKARLRVQRKVDVHTCNVFQSGAETRHLWAFDVHGGKLSLDREHTVRGGESLPLNVVGKDFRSLWKKKLNVAWLAPEHVFVRVIQLPSTDFGEILSMVELQLEKLSPMPVAQTVWSFHILPQGTGNLSTVVVLIAARAAVEEFLGQLEEQRFMADRLELPLLDQIQATPITENGAWIYPQASAGANGALVAWWCGGVLESLGFVSLPDLNRGASLKEQLLQMAWAGELEGWLKEAPRWHLVAEAPEAEKWEAALREALEEPIRTYRPLPAPELAARTARRAAQADPRANLLPAEFSSRYQQQFVDRLWMRSLLGVAGLYLVGVLIYFIAVAYASWRVRGVEQEVARRGPAYTNAIELRDLYFVLRDRQELKYAALDCWKVLAELLPASVNLESFNFSDGKKLTLVGSAPSDALQQLLDFETAMRKATINGQVLFDSNPTRGENLRYAAMGPNTYRWNFSVELKRSENIQ